MEFIDRRVNTSIGPPAFDDHHEETEHHTTNPELPIIVRVFAFKILSISLRSEREKVMRDKKKDRPKGILSFS
jgi:hypothetical protein